MSEWPGSLLGAPYRGGALVVETAVVLNIESLSISRGRGNCVLRSALLYVALAVRNNPIPGMWRASGALGWREWRRGGLLEDGWGAPLRSSHRLPFCTFLPCSTYLSIHHTHTYLPYICMSEVKKPSRVPEYTPLICLHAWAWVPVIRGGWPGPLCALGSRHKHTVAVAPRPAKLK